MALKDMFSAMKREGLVTAPLDRWLFEQSNRPNDRAINVNAPSQAGNCLRANYFMRMGVEGDGTIDPRTQRIFDNGTHVHLRLQSYLIEMGMLLMDEVPVLNPEHNIQGHTDGLLSLSDDEVGVLEIKSINDNQFTQLKDAKEEHKRQGLIYLYCLEERRERLHAIYKSPEAFNASIEDRRKYFARFYQHMKPGRKHSRESKIAYEVDLNLLADNILFYTPKPVSKVVFLYENKNNQELKEFVVESGSSSSAILSQVLHGYDDLNRFVQEGTVPPREGSSKTSNMCRWCAYKNECWVV